jgi:hypothetical protein
MKKRNLLLLPVLGTVFLFFFACRPEKKPYSLEYNWKFSGKVLEYGSNKPVPNAIVRLRHCESEFLGSTTCFTLDQDTTDDNGNYRFDRTDEYLFAYVDALAPEYYPLGQETLVNRMEEDNFDITLFAFSKLKLTFHNARDSTLTLLFSVPSADNPHSFSDTKILSIQDTTYLLSMPANRSSKILYHLRGEQGMLSEHYIDSVSCLPHETFYKKITL